MKISRSTGIRTGAWLGGVLALAACSGKTVNLGGANPLQQDGGGARAGLGGIGGGSGGMGEVPPESGVVSTGGVSGGGVVPDLPGIAQSTKLDLLIMVDNSASMSDKQKVLKATIPDLVNRLTAANSGVTDLHVGVITSSLGDHGANQHNCGGSDTAGNLKLEENDDHAHLVTTRPRAATLGIPDVISWDSTKSAATLTTQIQGAVTAVGEFGCGFEAQLESVYRFLVDPKPPLSITTQNCPGSTQLCAYPTGRDDALLAQRAAFLRPDSAVAIALLTDENDCSIRDTQQYFYAGRDDIALPHATAMCATNPNDKCCYSCAQTAPPAGCAPDPTCTPSTSSPSEDKLNLRCFNEKQRFGLDFLYPVQRYVTAFTRTHLCTSNVDLVPDGNCPDADKNGSPDIVENPLFYGNGTIRDRSMVYVLGLVGVPWQDLADGGPAASALQFKSASQMASDGTWNVILGDPEASPPLMPTDGLMVQSRSPRNGNDVTGALIPGPLATQAQDNPMNHHDWANNGQEDLMYACIFPVLEARDCVEAEKLIPLPGCDCASTNKPGDNNPLCQDPATGLYGSIQYAAKAYPGIRELSLLKGMGPQGVTASICPKNITDDTRSDYGYRPAIDSLVTQLKGSVH